MGKGFGGMPGNIQGLMKQAQKMQQELQRVQGEAEQLTSDGSAGGGAVKAVVNGKLQIVSLTISPEVVSSNDVEMLQDLVTAAVNEGLRKVQDTLKSEMAKVTGGMNVPGLF